MNTYITLSCLLAVAGLAHGGAIGLSGLDGLGGLGLGLGSPLISPVAISSANLYKAPPVSIIKTVVPVISSPVIRTISPIGISSIGPIGHSGLPLGVNGLGINGLGYGKSGLALGDLGWNGVGWNGIGSSVAWGKI